MKLPKHLVKRKLTTSLAIATFFALSLVTAYNISMNPSTNTDSETEVEDYVSSDDIPVLESISQATNNKASNHQHTENDTYPQTNYGVSDNDNPQDSTNPQSNHGIADNGNPQDSTNPSSNDARTNNTKGDSASQGTSKTALPSIDLSWPVVGNVILPYSMDTTVYYKTLDQYACNDGILISAEEGSQVQAACEGSVVNISDSDRYGTLLTLVTDEHYEIVYGQLDYLKVNLGDTIRKGDIIGSIAKPTRVFSLEGPHLYFHMSYNGEPVNPSLYLK